MSICAYVITQNVAQGIEEDSGQISIAIVETVRTIRNYYTEFVVNDVIASTDIEVTDMHGTELGTIPIPATFLIEMNRGNISQDISIQLTSPYPFASRADRHLDQFQQDAWNYFQTSDSDHYSVLEKKAGRMVFRSAAPDRMSQQVCVDCHNRHADSPMRNWEVGDVRGIIEVSLDVTEQFNGGRKTQTIVMAVIAAASTLLFLVAYRTVQRVSTPLNQLTQAMRALSQDEDAKVPDVTNGPAEVHQLADSFEVLQVHERERRRLAIEIGQLAFFDSLTGIPNRAKALDFLKNANRNPENAGRQIVAAIFDIDRFQDINNTRGHQSGDTVLKDLSDRLSRIMTNDELVARLGEDEFIYVGIHPQTETTADIEANLQHIRATMMLPVDLDNYSVELTASAGAAISEAGSSTPNDLMTCCDIALNRAKDQGRDQIVIYSDDLSLELHRRVETHRAIEHGLKVREFVPFFQPQISLITSDVVGAETLVRWRKSRNTILSPYHFIDLAEQSGAIVRLGTLMIRATCEYAAEWRERGIRFGRLSVNVSTKQLEMGNVAELLRIALQETGAQAEDIAVEVTESILAGDIEMMVDSLLAIKELGVEIALDDFGTGYSSLGYLTQLPIDKLKIDRSFVVDPCSATTDKRVFKTISDLGRSLNLKIIVEGIENDEQRLYAQSTGCHEVQGYLFGKPMTPEDFETFIKEHQSNLKHQRTEMQNVVDL